MEPLNDLIKKAHKTLNENRNAKYEITNETHSRKRNLRRIRALKSFRTINNIRVNEGDLGGYIETENNLSESGVCWVGQRATVEGNAQVQDNAFVGEDARLEDRAVAYGDAVIVGESLLTNNGRVGGNSILIGNNTVSDRAHIHGSIEIRGGCTIAGNTQLSETIGNILNSSFYDDTVIAGATRIEKCSFRGKNNISGDGIFKDAILNDVEIEDSSITKATIDEAIIEGEVKILGDRAPDDIYIYHSRLAGKPQIVGSDIEITNSIIVNDTIVNSSSTVTDSRLEGSTRIERSSIRDKVLYNQVYYNNQEV